MKTCNKCNIEKELINFSKLKHAKDGYQTQCKNCINENAKKYYTNNTEKVNQTTKRIHTSKSGIYEWIDGNTVLYVGQSSWLISRINAHKCWLKNPLSAPKHTHYLYKALNNHPNASIHIIEECLSEILLEREQYYIKIKKPLYNKIKTT